MVIIQVSQEQTAGVLETSTKLSHELYENVILTEQHSHLFKFKTQKAGMAGLLDLGQTGDNAHERLGVSGGIVG